MNAYEGGSQSAKSNQNQAPSTKQVKFEGADTVENSHPKEKEVNAFMGGGENKNSI
jgi:hypothetical protein